MRKFIQLFALFLVIILLLEGCTQANETMDSTESVLKKRIFDLESEINRLKQTNKSLETQNNKLQEQLNKTGILQDQLSMLTTNADMLFQFIKQKNGVLPVLYGAGDKTKEGILGSIDFTSKLIELHENELVLSAGLGDVEEKQSNVVVELTVYQNAKLPDDINPIKVMFLHMAKENGRWEIKSFNRTN